MTFAHKWLTAALNFLRTSVHADERASPDEQSIETGTLPYFLARDCCGILTAVADSPETHAYFVDLSALARCVRYSADISLAVRCGEIIFRVTRVHPSALHSAREFLGETLVAALDGLMSTGGISTGVCGIVRRIRPVDGGIRPADDTTAAQCNAALCVIHMSDIAIPPCLRTEATPVDERKWYHHAAPGGGFIQAFFGKTMVVLDWANKPALTIPYATIKCMKLNRHKQLVIRLKDIPFTLRGIYGDMRARLSAPDGVPKEALVPLSTETGTPLPFAEASRGDADAPPCFPEIIVSTTHDEYRKMRDAKIQHWIAAEMTADKKRRPDNPSQAVPGNVRNQPSRSANLSHVEDFVDGAVARKSLAVSESSAMQANLSMESMAPEKAVWGGDASYSNEIDPLLRELRQMVTTTVNASHQEGQRILDDARRQIEHEIASFHRDSEDRYGTYKRTLDRALNDLRCAQQRVEKDMTGLIGKLNIDVRSMAEQHTILAEQFSALERAGATGAREIGAHQDGQIVAMSEALSKSLRALAEKLHAAVSSTNPLRFMTQFLANAKRPYQGGMHPADAARSP